MLIAKRPWYCSWERLHYDHDSRNKTHAAAQLEAHAQRAFARKNHFRHARRLFGAGRSPARQPEGKHDLEGDSAVGFVPLAVIMASQLETQPMKDLAKLIKPSDKTVNELVLTGFTTTRCVRELPTTGRANVISSKGATIRVRSYHFSVCTTILTAYTSRITTAVPQV